VTATIGVTILSVIAGGSAAHGADAGRIAIIDASVSVKDYLDDLEAAGIKVIGRYMARCPQPEANVPQKRLIDNPGEMEAILAHKAGFGVLSIYQFYSSSSDKFAGKRRLAVPRDKEKQDWQTCDVPEDPVSAKREGELDGDAAVRQARDILKQPPGTAIYFGVDFDAGKEVEDGVVQYFTAVREKLTEARYLVGAYGSGASIRLLRNRPKPLIEFAWINSSRGHDGNVEVFNREPWDLLQTTDDIQLHLQSGRAMQVDTDVQNAKEPGKYIGFWNRDVAAKGRYTVPAERTTVTFDQRRFSCTGISPIHDTATDAGPVGQGIACGIKAAGCDPIIVKGKIVAPDPDMSRRVCFGNVARFLSIDATGRYAAIDCDENGKEDGFVRVDQCSRSFKVRPAWENDRDARRGLVRTKTNCE